MEFPLTLYFIGFTKFNPKLNPNFTSNPKASPNPNATTKIKTIHINELYIAIYIMSIHYDEWTNRSLCAIKSDHLTIY